MPKIRTIIFILLIGWAFWHFHGDTFEQSGTSGVINEIEADVHQIKENPAVIETIENINSGIQTLIASFTDKQIPKEKQSDSKADKPKLESPTEQPFTIHNVGLGTDREELENQVGKPERATMNEYGVDWVTYHDNYQNFFMAAYNDQNQVVGLYTNQDLLRSKDNIKIGSSKESIQNALSEPLQSIKKGFINYQIDSKNEYDVFQINDNYVTIFYDKHEDNTVTAIQMISGDLEAEKKAYLPEASKELKKGFEYQLFDLTNAARVEHGLSPLNWDEHVRKTARDHSLDMAENNYFSHVNPDGQSPFERMREDGIGFQIAGENIAAGQISSIFAHEGLMNSLGHRENILKEEYRTLAVGVAFNKDSMPFYTENFITK
ncbi:CAP domain-containing protein [Virgibacillus halodenitrificans]|uniref:CAP domain-containing protein n=1 Tax=Virgibacillus halodenitrificans TaxID=1482 RepID=UPI00045D0662|nr:CAP domain-containing protein [Virgibacillus halodenitrificans]CDQ35285.1 Cysteine-rich secretory protein family protein [Virgibacillus halodenitrificans]